MYVNVRKKVSSLSYIDRSRIIALMFGEHRIESSMQTRQIFIHSIVNFYYESWGKLIH